MPGEWGDERPNVAAGELVRRGREGLGDGRDLAHDAGRRVVDAGHVVEEGGRLARDGQDDDAVDPPCLELLGLRAEVGLARIVRDLLGGPHAGVLDPIVQALAEIVVLVEDPDFLEMQGVPGEAAEQFAFGQV